ncbi:MAG: hypothetical protein UU22_C0048G0002 [Parcubacteria group bacterium GW2011_GWA2_40_8]|nr:MAG: hypothetical protein UU22_C0048G0002 [Parcubacteria group bacterium GW2011_GWA2_40_8]
MKKAFKKIIIILVVLGGIFFLSASYFLIGTPPQAKEIRWGVNFSQKHAKDLGLDWRETYKALLDDLNVKRISKRFDILFIL